MQPRCTLRGFFKKPIPTEWVRVWSRRELDLRKLECSVRQRGNYVVQRIKLVVLGFQLNPFVLIRIPKVLDKKLNPDEILIVKSCARYRCAF